MTYIYFNSSEGKLHKEPISDVWENNSILISRTKTNLKCKILALKQSVININNETEELNSILSGVEDQTSGVQIIKDIVRKRDELLKRCRKQIQEINTEKAKLKNIVKKMNNSRVMMTSEMASKSLPGPKDNSLPNIVIQNSNMTRCLEGEYKHNNTIKIEKEIRRRLEQHKFVQKRQLAANLRNVIGEFEKSNVRINRSLPPRENKQNNCSNIRNKNLWKNKALDFLIRNVGINSIQQGKHPPPFDKDQNLYQNLVVPCSSTTTELGEYFVDNVSTELQNKEEKEIVSEHPPETSDSLDQLQLTLEYSQTKSNIETQQSINPNPNEFSNIFISKYIPELRAKISDKQLRLCDSQPVKFESKIICSQNTHLLRNTLLEFFLKARSEPILTLKLDSLNCSDISKMRMIFDPISSQDCNGGNVYNNKEISEWVKKDELDEIQSLKGMVESDSSKVVDVIPYYQDNSKSGNEEIDSNKNLQLLPRKRRAHIPNSVSSLQLGAIAQFKFLVMNKSDPIIKIITQYTGDKYSVVTDDSKIEDFIEKGCNLNLQIIADNVQHKKIVQSFQISELVNENRIRLLKRNEDNSQLEKNMLFLQGNTETEYGECKSIKVSKDLVTVLDPAEYRAPVQFENNANTSEILRNNYHQILNKTVPIRETISNKASKHFKHHGTDPIFKPSLTIGVNTETKKQNYIVTKDQTTETILIGRRKEKAVHRATDPLVVETQPKSRSMKMKGIQTKMILLNIKKKSQKQSIDSKTKLSVFLKKKKKKFAAEKVAENLSSTQENEEQPSLLNHSEILQTRVGINEPMIEQNELMYKNMEVHIENNVEIESKYEMETSNVEDRKELLVQNINVEMNSTSKNRTKAEEVMKTCFNRKSSDVSMKSYQTIMTSQQNILKENIDKNFERYQIRESLPENGSINDGMIFEMIESLQNLQTTLSQCQIDDDTGFPKKSLEELFVVFIDFVRKFPIKSNEFRNSNDKVTQTTEASTSGIINIENQVSKLSQIHAESRSNANREVTQDCTQTIENTDGQSSENHRIESRDESIERLKKRGKRIISGKRSSVISNMVNNGCQSSESTSELHEDNHKLQKHATGQQNSFCKLRCSVSDTIEQNPDDHYPLKRDFGVSYSMCQDKVDFNTSSIDRSKACSCDCMMGPERYQFGMMCKQLKSMHEVDHSMDCSYQKKGFSNHREVCRIITTLMRGLGDEEKVIGSTCKSKNIMNEKMRFNTTNMRPNELKSDSSEGKCDFNQHERYEIFTKGQYKNKNLHEFAGDMKKNSSRRSTPELKQFNRKQRTLFEDLLPFGKRLVLTPRRS
ncbi:uncharacterized protein LOC130891012 [Diorhabda carinulata]|uniref:uncharacterized protein LOC130891012 n=1 Tax=Diorhabda carinulata TaxID=1163345 RepID=UPI0025A289BA|nr:uncharacterized protein LOC130891012 [Diorhabda carinulata]